MFARTLSAFAIAALAACANRLESRADEGASISIDAKQRPIYVITNAFGDVSVLPLTTNRMPLRW